MEQPVNLLEEGPDLDDRQRHELESPVDPRSSFGALRTARGCLPLVALDVQAKLVALDAQVRLRQRFRNTLDEPIEATYIFPLPDRMAVTSFRLSVAGRVVQGVLQERAQARQQYNLAIRQGHRAAIAEEERSGTFTMRVGNLPPHEEAEVELTLVGPVPYKDGEATFRFPLVVAPRYTPGVPLDGNSVGSGTAADTNQVPDASRVTPPVMLPGFPNPVLLSLQVVLDLAGLEIPCEEFLASVSSSLHSVVGRQSGTLYQVSLRPGERLDRDFLLRYRLARPQLQSTAIVHQGTGSKPSTFALTLVPPEANDQPPKPRRIVFVLDRSGSMAGWKIVAARRALGRMLDTLSDLDQFNVLAFDGQIEAFATKQALLSASNRHRWQALEWLGTIADRGGTEMGPALTSAMECLQSNQDGEAILVLVTDGQVAGEDALLKTLTQAAGRSMPRIFALGIDRAVNLGFLNRLAEQGGGQADFVESEDRLDDVMDCVHRQIATPVLTDLEICCLDGNLVPDSLVPGRRPDLFAGRPVTIYGRVAGSPERLRLRIAGGTPSGELWQQEVLARVVEMPGLVSCWGRGRVRTLEDRYAVGVSQPQRLAQEIVAVSLESEVLSRFTAFVAVDQAEVVNEGAAQQEVTQPVERPADWELESEGRIQQEGRTRKASRADASQVRAKRARHWSPATMGQSLKCLMPAPGEADSGDEAADDTLISLAIREVAGFSADHQSRFMREPEEEVGHGGLDERMDGSGSQLISFGESADSVVDFEASEEEAAGSGPPVSLQAKGAQFRGLCMGGFPLWIELLVDWRRAQREAKTFKRFRRLLQELELALSKMHHLQWEDWWSLRRRLNQCRRVLKRLGDDLFARGDLQREVVYLADQAEGLLEIRRENRRNDWVQQDYLHFLIDLDALLSKLASCQMASPEMGSSAGHSSRDEEFWT